MMLDEEVKVMQRAVDGGDLRAACAIIEVVAGRTLGHKFFSVSRFHRSRALLERIYSSAPGRFPEGALKSAAGALWSEPLFERREVLILETPEALAAIYPEAGVMSELGLGAAINAPVEYAGDCIGTINLFDEAHCYRRDQERTARAVAQILAPAMRAFISTLDL
jgi:hypothetical protein